MRESDEREHRPAAEGFRSEHDGYMHACGHDAHLAMALGTLERVKESEFDGTLTVFFQPAEEISGGGKAMAESGYLDDIDYLLALHIGLDHPTGEIVAGIEKPLAMAHLTATFEGRAPTPAKRRTRGQRHAGGGDRDSERLRDSATQRRAHADQRRPNRRRYREQRHRRGGHDRSRGPRRDHRADGVHAHGTRARLLRRRRDARLRRHAAGDQRVPRVDSHPALRDLVGNVAWEVEGVERVVPTEEFGVSEDVTYLMERVQENGGLASYVLVGTDHPTSHHTPTFDIDEDSLEVGVTLLTETATELSRRRP